MRGTNRIENLIRDFAYAARTLRKSPIFAATAALTLALGIGASTALFSVTNAGLYGVLATAVRQRTAEIGVRMALGADPTGIFKLVVGQGLRLTAIGLALGLLAALALTRLMTAMLVGVRASDPRSPP